MKLTKYIFPLCIVSLLLAGCSCDSPEENETPEEPCETIELTPEQEWAEIIAERAFFIEETSNGTLTKVCVYGEATNPAFPDVIDLSLGRREEARDYFYRHFVPDPERKNLSGEESDMKYDLGEYGTAIYKEDIGAGMIAQIDVNMKLLPEVKRINILTKEAWPDNASSPFYPGDIVSSMEYFDGKMKKAYWLCVRACEGGQLGILMTLDFGWKSEWYSDHYKRFEKYTKCPPAEAWDALASFWYYDNQMFRAEYADIKNRGYGYVHDIFQRVIDAQDGRAQEQYYQEGDNYTKKHWWWAKARNVYKCTTWYVDLGNGTLDGYGIYRFNRSSYSFDYNDKPKFPIHRNSSIRYFGANINHELSKYTIVYPDDEVYF